ncbi:MAG: hypothetical protein WCC96_06570 [Rhodomicrobium sp.]
MTLLCRSRQSRSLDAILPKPSLNLSLWFVFHVKRAAKESVEAQMAAAAEAPAALKAQQEEEEMTP